MRIAQLAAPWISVPPTGYGGAEWVVQQLCDGLVARGHEVVLYASGDSQTDAELRALFPRQLPELMGSSVHDGRHVSFAFADIARERFDIIHDHSGFLAVAFSRCLSAPMIHTIHCAFDQHSFPFYKQFREAASYVAISNYQRAMAPAGMNWAGVVYNAIPAASWPFVTEKDDYLLAFGRVCEAKGFHLAIEAARRSNQRLVMAGVVQEPYREYFETRVAPYVDGEQITYEAEIDEARKRELFSHARAFLFPITWPEPFGLVMIEALACGTPVVALRNGSVPEVIDHGRTGFICDDLDGFVAALADVRHIDPQACRDAVESRFSVERMVDDYEAAYRAVAHSHD